MERDKSYDRQDGLEWVETRASGSEETNVFEWTDDSASEVRLDIDGSVMSGPRPPQPEDMKCTEVESRGGKTVYRYESTRDSRDDWPNVDTSF